MDSDDTDIENREYKIAGMINLRRLNIWFDGKKRFSRKRKWISHY